MTNRGWFSRLSNQQPSAARIECIAGGIGVAIILTMTSIALAQNPTPDSPFPATYTQVVAPQGYSLHQSVDLGGHMVGRTGSSAMYDTLVNIQSGPRVLGQTFELRALPGTKHTLVDYLRAMGNGFGGDPNNFAKLDFSKGKVYEFSGLFRRDREYFNYDLLSNPNIPASLAVPFGQTAGVPSASTIPWQVRQSPIMYNTVRRMTDTYLTIFPLSKVTFRAGYSQNIFQGPSLNPNDLIGKSDAVLEQYQRNSTDDFTGAVDWKPLSGTRLTFEEQIDHYKADSFFTLNPNGFKAQEADGTPVVFGDWDNTNTNGQYPVTTSCNTGSMGGAFTNATTYTILTVPQTPGGLPVINAACDVTTKYLRSQPTRILYPTEIFRMQSSSIKNISMNGDFRYTDANMNLPNYYENFQGLNGTIRSLTFTGKANAHRAVVAADYGIVWQASRKVSFSDQIDFSNVHQPGATTMTSSSTLSTPGNPNEIITYTGALTPTTGLPGSATFQGGGGVGVRVPGYFGQRFLTNNATATWDATPRASFSLTYRYGTHRIVQTAGSGPTSFVVNINENGGIFNAALRPTDHWDVNGTVEMFYDDNAFTPVGPRQTKHYRVHTTYKPRPWATFTGAFNDRERHNNTNNIGATPDGPINHVDHSRVVSLDAVLAPNEHYGIDLNYAYSDVYTSTNSCYEAQANPNLPGAATAIGTICPGTGTSPFNLAEYGPVKDFMDAPTHSGSAALSWSPVKSVHSNLGYRISSVNGSQLFNDARAVNGSLNSTYQTPFVDVAWTVHPGWIWKAEYKYYGYGEGGPSGAALCSFSNPTSTTPAPGTACNSSTFAAFPTGLTEPSSGLTAPRSFHANNVTLSMHYEF